MDLKRTFKRTFIDSKTRLRRSLGIRRASLQVSWLVESPEHRLSSRTTLFHHQDPESFPPDSFVGTGPVRYDLTLYSSNGRTVLKRSETIERFQTKVYETMDLLKEARVQTPFHGQVFINVHQFDWGSLRAYIQWYNENAITSTHERRYPNIGLMKHFYTVPRALCHLHKDLEIYVAIVNSHPKQKADLKFILQTDDGFTNESATRSVAPNGSLFVSLYDLFPNCVVILKEGLGSIYLANTDVSLTIYYFTYNKETGAWQTQHI